MPELTPQQRVFRAQELYSDTVSLQRTGEDHHTSLKALSAEAVQRVEAALAEAKMPTMEKAWEECMATLSPEDKKHFEELNNPGTGSDGMDALHKLDKWLYSIAIGLDVAWAVSALSFWGAQKYVVGALDNAEKLEARLLRAELQALARTGSLRNATTLKLGEELTKTEAKVAKGITAAEKLALASKWAGRLGIIVTVASLVVMGGVAVYEHDKEKKEVAEQRALIRRLGASRLYAGITSKYLGVLNDQAGMYNGPAIYLETMAPGATPEEMKKAITSYLSNIIKKVKEKSGTYSETAILNDLKTRYDDPRKSVMDEDPTLSQMQEEHTKILERAFPEQKQ